VRRGRGVFATEFGSISYEPGDWVLMPKVTTFRQSPEAGDDLLLVIESLQPIRLCEHEQVGRHTPIDPTMQEVILRPRRASRYSAEASICSDSTKCPKSPRTPRFHPPTISPLPTDPRPLGPRSIILAGRGPGSGESQIGDIGRGSGRRSYHQQPWLSSLSAVPQARCARNPRRCQVLLTDRPECLAAAGVLVSEIR
jgi:hypothetical protein